MSIYRYPKLMPLVLVSFLNLCLYAFVLKVIASQLIVKNLASFVMVSLLLSLLLWLCVLIWINRRIVIRGDKRIVELHRILYPRSFFDVIPGRKVCVPFDDIVSVSTSSVRWRQENYHWVVYTVESRFGFSEKIFESDALVHELRSIGRGNGHTENKIEQSDNLIHKCVVLVVIGVLVSAVLLAVHFFL